MKKLLILSIAMFTLFSCSSDDENNVDPIIGAWHFVNADETDCEKQNKITFNEDGTYVSLNYYEDNGECMLEETTNGTWENNENGTYKFAYTTVENNVDVSFSNNNNTMTLDEGGADEEVYTRIN